MAGTGSNISLITVMLNAVSTLRDNLESVGRQCLSVEHILVDGGSIDGSLTIASRFPHVSRILSEPDRGIYDAMNKGLDLVTGDVVGILNADDFYAGPDVLVKVANAFENPKVDACYGDLIYVRDYGNGPIPSERGGLAGDAERLNGRPWEKEDRFKAVRYWRAGPYEKKKFYWGWMPPHPTFFVRRPVYEKFGGFNLNLGSAADYELMVRFLLKHNINAVYIPEVLVKMRTGGKSNASLKNRLIANRFDRMAWKVNGLNPYPWTLTVKPLRKIGQYFFK
jgi:glycosyltransferase involved in cell wall biosynthesis